MWYYVLKSGYFSENSIFLSILFLILEWFVTVCEKEPFFAIFFKLAYSTLYAEDLVLKHFD